MVFRKCTALIRPFTVSRRSMMWIELRLPARKGFIFGFQRLVRCPKWTPASSSSWTVTIGKRDLSSSSGRPGIGEAFAAGDAPGEPSRRDFRRWGFGKGAKARGGRRAAEENARRRASAGAALDRREDVQRHAHRREPLASRHRGRVALAHATQEVLDLLRQRVALGDRQALHRQEVGEDLPLELRERRLAGRGRVADELL